MQPAQRVRRVTAATAAIHWADDAPFPRFDPALHPCRAAAPGKGGLLPALRNALAHVGQTATNPPRIAAAFIRVVWATRRLSRAGKSAWPPLPCAGRPPERKPHWSWPATCLGSCRHAPRLHAPLGSGRVSVVPLRADDRARDWLPVVRDGGQRPGGRERQWAPRQGERRGRRSGPSRRWRVEISHARVGRQPAGGCRRHAEFRRKRRRGRRNRRKRSRQRRQCGRRGGRQCGSSGRRRQCRGGGLRWISGRRRRQWRRCGKRRWRQRVRALRVHGWDCARRDLYRMHEPGVRSGPVLLQHPMGRHLRRGSAEPVRPVRRECRERGRRDGRQRRRGRRWFARLRQYVPVCRSAVLAWNPVQLGDLQCLPEVHVWQRVRRGGAVVPWRPCRCMRHFLRGRQHVLVRMHDAVRRRLRDRAPVHVPMRVHELLVRLQLSR